MSLNCVTAGISECLQSILWCPFVACFKAGGQGSAGIWPQDTPVLGLALLILSVGIRG